MKVCKLDGRQRSKAAILSRVARDLGFPAHFGGNLDALFDILTTDIEGPFTIRWRPTANARAALGADFGRIRSTLEDAARERKDMTLDLAA